MPSTPSSEDLLLAEVRRWCQEHLHVESVAEAEELALTLSRQVAEVIVTEGLQQAGGRASYEGCSVPCACGRRARFVSYRPRWIVTRAGSARVARAYYHCKHCGSGQAPWDRRQGLSSRQWTAGVKSLVANFAGRLPYAEAVELLELSTGLRVEEFSAEQLVAEVGAQLRARAAQEQAEVWAGEAPIALTPVPARLYVGLDGTHAHIDNAWHEVKTGVIYAGVPDAEGQDQAEDCHYVAAQETAEAFGERAYGAAVGRGVEQAAEVVVIGDGAKWIWNLAALHYPQATEIVDYWHACEHIWELRAVLYPEGSGAGERWARAHCRRLKEHGPGSLLGALGRLRPASAAAQEAVRGELGYFQKHRERMRYPAYRARGLMIGSGPVEAGCKVVVGHRLKRAGMRWSGAGADAVLAVRCALLNHEEEHLAEAARLAA
jgi:hypothetical protein